MPQANESDNFTLRLQLALAQVGFPADSASALAREFNRRHPGAPITVHTTRKWLAGQAVPTQEKLRTLADWLAVSPAWLGFGAAAADGVLAPSSGAPTLRARVNLSMLADLHRLDEAHRQLVRDFVHTLLKLQRVQGKDGTEPDVEML